MVTLKCSPKVDMVRRSGWLISRFEGRAQSSRSLFENEHRAQQRRIGSCWPVEEESVTQSCCRQSIRLTHTLRSAHSMTRPPENFPAPTTLKPAHSPTAPMPRYPLSALWLLGSSIRSAHANARDKDQPNELRARHLRPHTPSTRDLQLQLWSSFPTGRGLSACQSMPRLTTHDTSQSPAPIHCFPSLSH